MMAKNSLKSLYNIPYGTIIKGKWHKETYKIIKELGSGANGVVYLADWNRKRVALKVSDRQDTITTEVNVLRSLSKAQGMTLGPSLLDVDDWELGDRKVPFYVMEYIEGVDFLTFVRSRGLEWLEILILQLLTDLDELHKEGWVFGDLKPENLLVSGPPIRIRCVDVGGTTRIGRAIKEFTEFFDRGYWGLGSRKAEAQYDLFAVAMVIINTFYPKRFQRVATKDGLSQIIEKIEQIPELKKRRKVLMKALKGEYISAAKMKEDISQLKFVRKKRGKQTLSNRRKTREFFISILESLFILSMICLIYAIYVLGKIL